MVLYAALFNAHNSKTLRSQDRDCTIGEPQIIPRSAHNISRSNISSGALKVLYTLNKAGYEAFLVGGGVRDLLLGTTPKDFDVATNAHPEEIRKLFRNCRLIGRRFRLAHVRFGRDVVEVATFRGATSDADDEDHLKVNGRIVRDNVYGTLEEDAVRRDFSINCLYYNIADFSVVDFTGGMADLQSRILRLIGDPETRYREDPVRTLRALRFAAKLGFRIDPASEVPLARAAEDLAEISPARLFEEILKLFMEGSALKTFQLLRQYGVFELLFPETNACLNDEEADVARRMVERALENTDARIQEGKPVTPAFLFAALLWEPLRQDVEAMIARGMSPFQAYDLAGVDVIARQVEHVALPKRFSVITREIWEMQPRLQRQRGARVKQILSRTRFRAAYDFLLLRAEAGEPVAEAAQWWTRLQEGGEVEQSDVVETPKRGRRRRRRRNRRPAAQ
ncbi:MAG: polynucleotide adenylyltransferase PcnB [Gammaproteobacteria bacterium]|nr:polynucleotide adenylyltransferase PcnB [Gammaproteobacteria bacterium]MDH3412855.1 polynucleotide adenylyltransferase PcnB [Gammaproteobacteria bacterium]